MAIFLTFGMFQIILCIIAMVMFEMIIIYDSSLLILLDGIASVSNRNLYYVGRCADYEGLKTGRIYNIMLRDFMWEEMVLCEPLVFCSFLALPELILCVFCCCFIELLFGVD